MHRRHARAQGRAVSVALANGRGWGWPAGPDPAPFGGGIRGSARFVAQLPGGYGCERGCQRSRRSKKPGPSDRVSSSDRWSRHSDLNRGPAVYETAALPLSYVGLERESTSPSHARHPVLPEVPCEVSRRLHTATVVVRRWGNHNLAPRVGAIAARAAAERDCGRPRDRRQVVHDDEVTSESDLGARLGRLQWSTRSR